MHFIKSLSSVSDGPSILEELIDAIKNDFFTINFGDYEHLDINEGGIVSVPLVVIGIAIGIVIGAFAYLFTRGAASDLIKALVYQNCRDPKTAKTLSELGFGRDHGVRSAVRSGSALRRYVRYVDALGRTDPLTKSSLFHGEVPVSERRRAEKAEEAAKAEEKAEEKSEEITEAAEPTESTNSAEPTESAEPQKEEVEPVKNIAPAIKELDIDTVRFFIIKPDCDEALKRFAKKRPGPLAIILTVVVALLIIIVTFKALPGLLQMLDNFIGMFQGEKNYI